MRAVAHPHAVRGQDLGTMGPPSAAPQLSPLSMGLAPSLLRLGLDVCSWRRGSHLSRRASEAIRKAFERAESAVPRARLCEQRDGGRHGEDDGCGGRPREFRKAPRSALIVGHRASGILNERVVRLASDNLRRPDLAVQKVRAATVCVPLSAARQRPATFASAGFTIGLNRGSQPDRSLDGGARTGPTAGWRGVS